MGCQRLLQTQVELRSDIDKAFELAKRARSRVAFLEHVERCKGVPPLLSKLGMTQAENCNS